MQHIFKLLLLSAFLVPNTIRAQIEDKKPSKFLSTVEFSRYAGATEKSPAVGVSILYLIKDNLGIGPSLSYINYNGILGENMLNIGMRSQLKVFEIKKLSGFTSLDGGIGIPFYRGKGESVSYTHLTLPTIYSV